MKRTRMLLAACAALCVGATVGAYETSTHAAITLNAYQQSNLTQGTVLQALGLDLLRVDPNPLGPFRSLYSDVSGSQVYQRYAYQYERSKIFPIDSNSDFLIEGWLMRGAVREDDLGAISIANIWTPNGSIPIQIPIGPDPHDDPYGSIFRVFNHFYDPVSGNPLNGGVLTPIICAANLTCAVTAPNWAVGSADAFSQPNAPLAGRRNHFSVFDAREAMFRALTLLQTNPDGSISPIYDPSTTTSFNGTQFAMMQANRLNYWATTFRSLGDVLHLNQDMAQPQHTRNEPHSGQFETVSVFGNQVSNVFGHSAVYENYIEALAVGVAPWKFTLQPAGTPTIQISPATLNYAGYPIPTFSNYTDAWSTQPNGNVTAGNGLADYSNRGFFTVANNYGGTNYALPASSLSAYNIVIQQATSWAGVPLQGAPVALLEGSVPDTLNSGQSTSGVPLTTYSVWDQFMSAQGQQPTFTLNRINYDAMSGLLLPRATAYSAGLLNYFFRGSMAISLPHEGVYGIIDHSTQYGSSTNTDPLSRTQGFSKIKLTLTNTTPVTNPPTELMTGGTLTAVIKFRRNLQFTDDLTNEPGAPNIDGLAAVRGDVEEIVASTATKDHLGNTALIVSLPQGTPQEYEFDFDQVLPLNATDVFLQVIYKGSLGNESNALVVATTDMSEPTYFSYTNAFDYIHIGGSVYTFSTVNNDPNLLAQVSPANCILSSQSPPPVGSLNPSCFSPNQTLSVALDANDPTQPNPLISAQNVAARHYFRVAILTDGGTGQSSLKQQSICVPATPFVVPALNNEHALTTPGGSEITAYTSPLSTQRGILGWYMTSCVYNGDDSPAGTTDNRATAMLALGPPLGAADEIYPVPVTINFPQPQ